MEATELVERSRLQPEIDDALEPLGSNTNVFDEGVGEDFEELDAAYEDIEESKQMSALEYRVEELHDKCVNIERGLEAIKRNQATYHEQSCSNITFSLEPVNKMLTELAAKMTAIEDKMDKILAVGVAMQSGTEPVFPRKSEPAAAPTIVNQIIHTPLDSNFLDDILTGNFTRK